MNLEQFYKEIKNFAVYPGTIDGLNELQSASRSNIFYKDMPVGSGNRFITGIYIPTVQELFDIETARELASRESSVKSAKFEEVADYLRDKVCTLFSCPETIDHDVRLKAKKIGAEGLVHFRPFGDGVYMGVPIKRRELLEEM